MTIDERFAKLWGSLGALFVPDGYSPEMHCYFLLESVPPMLVRRADVRTVIHDLCGLEVPEDDEMFRHIATGVLKPGRWLVVGCIGEDVATKTFLTLDMNAPGGKA